MGGLESFRIRAGCVFRIELTAIGAINGVGVWSWGITMDVAMSQIVGEAHIRVRHLCLTIDGDIGRSACTVRDADEQEK
ncbi:hypothetical protein RRSWK_03376 [Rhodopirellula sp. SWK7]|nr:hypothetical protein RRSWK_03376 [Rhodopirellula sp. SWK7]